ncbi:MAG: hypothetical protein ACOC35_01170, partial [Promethearchaeia archaeon]
TIAALIEYEGKKFGLEIPSVKSFDRSAGVAGYYAVKRLRDAINDNVLDEAILIVPKETGGAKYTMMLENNPEIHKIEIIDSQGEELIASALEYPPSEIGWLITKAVFKDIGEYPAPEPEEGQGEGESQ